MKLEAFHLVLKIFRISFISMLLCGLSLGQAPRTLSKSSRASAAAAGNEKSVVVKNSWQGLTPLRSSTVDVAKMLGFDADAPAGSLIGPYRVEDGEVSFSYLTPSLAKLYRAPASLTNKVFAIYFKPATTLYRADLKLAGFKECREDGIRGTYYLVNDAGLAYQFKSSNNLVERIIYQPSRAEVRRLAVNTECVF
jgi:hypothetical protein